MATPPQINETKMKKDDDDDGSDVDEGEGEIELQFSLMFLSMRSAWSVAAPLKQFNFISINLRFGRVSE